MILSGVNEPIIIDHHANMRFRSVLALQHDANTWRTLHTTPARCALSQNAILFLDRTAIENIRNHHTTTPEHFHKQTITIELLGTTTAVLVFNANEIKPAACIQLHHVGTLIPGKPPKRRALACAWHPFGPFNVKSQDGLVPV